MRDYEEEKFLEELIDIDSGRGGADEVPFVLEIAYVLSSAASVIGQSMVSAVLDIMHLTIFGFDASKKQEDDGVTAEGTWKVEYNKALWRKVWKEWWKSEKYFVGQGPVFSRNDMKSFWK